MITLTGITKTYDGRSVLDIPSLMIEPGQRCALMGVNGCGKTTLLRVLAGVLAPDTGGVSGLPLDSTGYLPQTPYAFGFSVQNNVAIALSKSERAASQVMESLKAVGMAEMARARGHQLSGGERQRMAFARMIVKPRCLLLLDEPTASTDIQGTDQIENALLRYAQDSGCTVIIATHSPAQALRLAESVVYLDHGRIAEQGSADKVLRHPRNPGTRQFLRHWRI